MAAGSGGQTAKTAHVNMMTDTMVTNLPAENLRAIVRSLLAIHPEITTTFEAETRSYIEDVALPTFKAKCPSSTNDLALLKETKATVRCMLGCGFGFESIPLMQQVVAQSVKHALDPVRSTEEVRTELASIDGDIVQVMTAVEKTLLLAAREELADDEYKLVSNLHEALVYYKTITDASGMEYPYERAILATSMLLGLPPPTLDLFSTGTESTPGRPKETFEMNKRQLPRLFTGLWQLSSPSWGSAPTSKIIAQFSKHVEAGMTAFDMADHYGDAEIIFVSYCESCQL